jgi:ABC-2 type transport system permease protein
MSILVVAKKDFQDAIRSKVFWAVSALFALLVVGLGAAYASFDLLNGGDPTGVGLSQFLASGITLFVAVTAIVVCNRAIAGERESGSLRLLLSLPHTRLDVVVGKLIGRTAVLAVPILGSLVIGAVIGSAIGGVFEPVPIAVTLVVALLFVLTYVGIFVGVSALTKSTTLALAAGVAYFLVFEVLWNLVGTIVILALNGFEPLGAGTPDWYYVFQNVPPSNSYSTVFSATLEATTDWTPAPSTAPPDTFYGTPWIGLAIMALWFVVPLAVGYARFSTTDL